MAHPTAPQLTIGVDTHLDVHVAHAADQLGRRVATLQAPTTPAGYQHLLAWARGLGEPVAWGVEGTGSYGAALARFLAANDQVVVEVNRPDRQARRRHGKSDPLDGQVEMIRSLRAARHTAMRGRTQTINALKALLVTAPTELREQLRGMSATRLVRTAADLEPGPITSPLAAAMLALRLARRHQALSAEIDSLTSHLDRLTTTTAPRLVALFGIGQDSAGALLVAAGDNPWPAAQRGLLRDAVRLLADPGLLRQDHPASPQSGRRPPSQRRAAPDRGGAVVPPPADQGLHGQAPHRRQVQERPAFRS